MEIKLFGKKIFEFRSSKSQALIYNSTESLKKSAFLPDFYTFRAHSTWDNDFLSISELSLNAPGTPTKNKKTKVVLPPPKPPELTPKEVHQLKLLNSTVTLHTDADYVDAQIQQFKDKLDLIKANEYDVSRGTNEIASILVRMENRKQYPPFSGFYDEFAYTTTEKINDLVKAHDYLQLGTVDTFLADMPKEAVDVMKDYTAQTVKLCKKKPIFYIIANKKDFQKKDKRRDPILLAQSPFGHFWQILGAWDEEMLFLDEL